MNLQGKELLRLMAQQAKNRLRGKTEKPTKTDYYRSFRIMTNDYNNVKITIIKNDDKEYNKVKEILDSGEEFSINELIDFKLYKSMSREQRERYFFNLADKYRDYRQRYESEKDKELCSSN